MFFVDRFFLIWFALWFWRSLCMNIIPSATLFLLILVLHGFEDSSLPLRVRVSTLDAASMTKKRLLGVLKPIFLLNQFKST